MKLIKKLLLATAFAAVTATSAQASTINVGGVVWDPNAPSDFSGVSATLRQFIDPTTGELSGFGVITTINGTGVADFCPGCELTVQYSGYMPFSSTPTGSVFGPKTEIDYIGGTITVYVDHNPLTAANPSDPLALNLANTGPGDAGGPWLVLSGHGFGPNNITLVGTLEGTMAAPTRLEGGGFWDVVGGQAFGNMNTNTQTDGSDFAFSNTFRVFQGLGFLAQSATGDGNFKGDSIPEPASILLLGLGLFGLASSRYRKAR